MMMFINVKPSDRVQKYDIKIRFRNHPRSLSLIASINFSRGFLSKEIKSERFSIFVDDQDPSKILLKPSTDKLHSHKLTKNESGGVIQFTYRFPLKNIKPYETKEVEWKINNSDILIQI